MSILENKHYLAILENLSNTFPFWNELQEKTFFISGATGMIGSLLVDLLMLHNEKLSAESRCHIIAMGRNKELAEQRFFKWLKNKEFSFFQHDITIPFETGIAADYFIHAASTTHPVAYSTEPINTICSNILGTRNMLELVVKRNNSRFILLSSVEIYGKNKGDIEYFDEKYCGYIDCNTLRAGYPESKRLSEALCQAYIQERTADAVILRLPRIYGPTMRMSDSKAIAQFIKNGIAKKNIVLKSKGSQLYSYLHTTDSVLAILWVLLKGEKGEAYNASDKNSDITLVELAEMIAKYAGTKVVFELPEETESKGYSTAKKALMDTTKLNALGWHAHCNMQEGIKLTMEILENEDC